MLLRRTQPQLSVVTVDADQGVGNGPGASVSRWSSIQAAREACRPLSYVDRTLIVS